MSRAKASSSEAFVRSSESPAESFGEGARQEKLSQTIVAQYIWLRLALTLPVMALAPVFLLARGAPRLDDALTFALLLMPLVGVYFLRRSGRLEIAHAICVAAMILLGVNLTCAHGALGVGAAACFLLALLEAAAGAAAGVAKRVVFFGAGLTLVAAAVVVLATSLGLLQPAAHPGALDSAILAAAVIYGALLAVWSARVAEIRTRAARRDEASLRELTASIGDVVLRIDAGGRVVEVVTRPEESFGCSAESLLGRGLCERILVSDRPHVLKCVADTARSEDPACIEFRLRAGPEGRDLAPPHFIWVELRARRSQDKVLASLRDLTPMKEAQAESLAAQEAGEKIGLCKDRLLANVSHELRTPLNAIIGFSEILGNPDIAPRDPARQREYADIINASGQHLLGLVNTILDMSKIETGHFEIEPEPFDLPWLIDLCCDMVKLKAEAKKIALSRACPSRLEDIFADKRACKQILLNLISNALKFTPDGGKVIVTASADGPFVEIAVSDTGIGVTQKDLSRLGDPFFQVKSTCDRPYEGAGLGLSIVRGLVGLQGGSISFESAPGEGARVAVRLPMDCRRIPKSAATPAKIETLPRRGRPVPTEFHPHLQVKKIA
jgi:two-component system, cell cycle sensor histidine kinase DivJ